MKLLAIETATEACSVALWLDGEMRERFEIAPRGHAARILPWAEALLAGAGLARSALDAIAVGRGPGAFTGVRLAVAAGQGLALALDRPLIGVSSLAALAEATVNAARVLAALDARMGEVYIGAFERDDEGLVRALDAERVCAPGEVEAPPGSAWTAVGPGFAAVSGALVQRLAGRLESVDASALPHAAMVARLAALGRGEASDNPAVIEPAYLRQRVAQTLEEQRLGEKTAPLGD